MMNFQLKYELSVVFDKIILCFVRAVFSVVFNKKNTTFSQCQNYL